MVIVVEMLNFDPKRDYIGLLAYGQNLILIEFRIYRRSSCFKNFCASVLGILEEVDLDLY